MQINMKSQHSHYLEYLLITNEAQKAPKKLILGILI